MVKIETVQGQKTPTSPNKTSLKILKYKVRNLVNVL